MHLCYELQSVKTIHAADLCISGEQLMVSKDASLYKNKQLPYVNFPISNFKLTMHYTQHILVAVIHYDRGSNPPNSGSYNSLR